MLKMVPKVVAVSVKCALISCMLEIVGDVKYKEEYLEKLRFL